MKDQEEGWRVFTEDEQVEVEDLRAEVARLRNERAYLRRALFATRPWVGIQPRNAKEMRAMLEARDDAWDALDYHPRTEESDA